uniref:DUF4124 domain-containing protein n=1 Tax=Desulfatirhabdium butyrativorans TaxID=340467 RepID=A0A7C4MSN3_9BACT
MGSTAMADIYVYVDQNGVRHFTNTPTSSKYKLYSKDIQRYRYTPIFSGNLRFNPEDPAIYDGLIEMASRTYGVSPKLLKAIIKVESNFNPKARSRKEAKGLMQIMSQNYDELNIDNPFDPYQNIMGGTKYLKQLLEKYNNHLDLAFAAYNAGPGAVDKYNGIPPYPETIDYVRKVKSYYQSLAY